MTQAVQATYDDANLLLRLYEMRREEKMREARAWFVANFKPKSMADIQDSALPARKITPACARSPPIGTWPPPS